MTAYYVDDSGDDGDGSFGNPWNNVSGHTEALGPNDAMYIRGDSPTNRVYTESPIVCGNNGSSGNPITILAYPGEGVTIKTTPEASNDSLAITGNWWVIDDLGFDKDHIGGGSKQILINGSANSVIRNCELFQNGGDGAIFFHGDNGGTNITIDACTIYDTFKGNSSDSAGILIGSGDDITIKNCTIYDCRGDCITADEDWGSGTVGTVTVEDCHLYTTLGKCSENACDLKDGTLIVRRNIMHGFRYCDSTCGGSGGGIGDAVTIHSQATIATIYDNEIYDCVSGISVGCPATIRNNLIRDLVTDAAAWLNTAINPHGNASDTDIFNNTFAHCPEHVLYFSTGTTSTLKNNLFYETHDIYVHAAATATYDYNGWFNYVDRLVGAHDTTGSGDPGFKDAANDNYRLRRSSAAINAGVDVGLAYRGPKPDLGYEEHRGFVIASTWL